MHYGNESWNYHGNLVGFLGQVFGAQTKSGYAYHNHRPYLNVQTKVHLVVLSDYTRISPFRKATGSDSQIAAGSSARAELMVLPVGNAIILSCWAPDLCCRAAGAPGWARIRPCCNFKAPPSSRTWRVRSRKLRVAWFWSGILNDMASSDIRLCAIGCQAGGRWVESTPLFVFPQRTGIWWWPATCQEFRRQS